MSPLEPARGRRAVFAVLLLFAFGLSASHAVGMSPQGVPSWFLQPGVWGVLTLAFLASLTGWVLGRHERTASFALLALLFTAGHVEMAARGVTMPVVLHVIVTAVFTAWVVCWLAGSGSDEPARRARAHEAACGVYAAIMFLAGFAKLRYSGLAWVDGDRHAFMILERSFATTTALDTFRSGLAGHPALLEIGASYTLAIECAAPLFLVPRLRKWFALAMLPLPVGLAFTFGFFPFETATIPLVLAWGGFDKTVGATQDALGASKRAPAESA